MLQGSALFLFSNFDLVIKALYLLELVCTYVLVLCIAVYMSRHQHLWEGHEVFDSSLRFDSSSSDKNFQPPKTSTDSYGSGKTGCTYELCAGIVDKNKPLPQIVHEEIVEETGKYSKSVSFNLLIIMQVCLLWAVGLATLSFLALIDTTCMPGE